ncbi:hypothetical protein GGR57DRAFT_511820 [Xylariaceae sp. FL1272]|nr:hypothetical protein GGR57DRAFT_511820 [Xylariaceae sp. FL1272]
MSTEENWEDDLIGDEPDPIESQGVGTILPVNISDEEKAWTIRELHDQCKDVLKQLSDGKRRWDHDTGDSNVEVLEEYKKRLLAERRGHSNEPTRMTALHILARSTSEFSESQKSARECLVHYLLDNWPHAASEQMLIFEVALFYENHEFIDCVEACMEGAFADFLHLKDVADKNCLHHLFAWPLKRCRNVDESSKELSLRKGPEDNELYLQQLRRLALKASPETLAAGDTEGNTPIHYAMHAKQCYDRGDEYVTIVKDLIIKADEVMKKSQTIFNKRGESPVMYCRRVLDEVREESKQAKAKARSKPNDDETAPNREVQRRTEGFVKPADKTPIHGQTLTTTSNVQHNDVAYHGALQRTVTNPIDIPADKANSNKKREPLRAPNPSTANSNSQSSSTTKTATTGLRACQLLSDFLKSHYTWTRSDLTARDIIFGRGAEGWSKNLYFDARGLQDTAEILELLNRMKTGGFGTTLSYVNLPAIRRAPVDPTHGKADEDSGDDTVPLENPRMGRTDLIKVFNELRKVKVTHIWRLEVEDRQTPSHTDGAIEIAIQGTESTIGQTVQEPISIHTWDWRKPDLSTDVIAFAAPTVKIVNLYWTGNHTVLKAWGCNQGIPRLHSITGVERIIIHACPGLESVDRMKKSSESTNKSKKKTAQLDETQNDNSLFVEIQYAYNFGDRFVAADRSEGNAEYFDDSTTKQHAWVDTMDEFHRVRVALIDDGVDLGSVDMYGKIAQVTGLSFHPSDRHTENPWHYSSGGHGTIMANMILRINPWVDLSIIKIHCGISHSQGRTISARSAADASRAAIDMKVQIISVSWTIKHRGIAIPNQSRDNIDPSRPVKKDPLTLLAEAIDKVKRAGIILFCSSSDDIQTTAMKVLPYSQQPEHIFRIGAALWLGQRDPSTETPDRIDWYFPGNHVAEAKNPRLQGPVKYHDGSSVGTALAAGLASLLMFLSRVLHIRYARINNFSEAKLFEKCAEGLKDRTKMKQAFDMMGKQGHYQQDKKYLPVWDTFHDAIGILKQTKDEESKWEELAKLVKLLCSDFAG